MTLPVVVELADAALAQRQVRLRVDDALVGVQRGTCPTRVGSVTRLDALDELLALQAIADQVGDRAHLQLVLLAELLQVRPAGHLAIVAHDLADDRRRLQPRQAARSTVPSVCPARTSTPAVAGRSGLMWPGRSRSCGWASSAIATWMVLARSWR